MKARTNIVRTLDSIPPRWQFAVFLGTTVLISLGLTVLAYALYIISGTSQLDLSRPGYKAALEEVSPTDTDDYGYSSNGPLDAAALSEFKSKYDALTNKTKGYSAFDPNALSDEQLNLNGTGNVIGPQ